MLIQTFGGTNKEYYGSIVGGADTLLVGRTLQPFSLISDVVSCKQKNYGNVVLFIEFFFF